MWFNHGMTRNNTTQPDITDLIETLMDLGFEPADDPGFVTETTGLRTETARWICDRMNALAVAAGTDPDRFVVISDSDERWGLVVIDRNGVLYCDRLSFPPTTLGLAMLRAAAEAALVHAS
jgi:hypothetical protein